MSTKGAKSSGSSKDKSVFGLNLTSWLEKAEITTAKDGKDKAKSKDKKDTFQPGFGRILYFGAHATKEDVQEIIKDLPIDWQLEWALKRDGQPTLVSCKKGPVWILKPAAAKNMKSDMHDGRLEKSPYAKARDLVGAVFPQTFEHNLSIIELHTIKADETETLGALVGLELAAYRYIRVKQPKPSDRPLPKLKLVGSSEELRAEASALAMGCNIARHLVNTPADELTPLTYGDAVKKIFKDYSTMKVEVWDQKRLEKEGMGLILAVGKSAEHGPSMVHLSYRPKGKKRLSKPVALVGKGITFDSGGLNLKPGDSMRNMKKDMGGSASLVGLAWWMANTELDVACDFYLALAENAIDSTSFCPGDVIKARNGVTVEIHNTDAEGRLVLADAIDVAVKQKGADEPAFLIDVATLTGAARVAIGTKIGAMFSNHDELARQVETAGFEAGDLCWRMPLFEEYADGLRSFVADMTNCSPSRFAGAITAALFLQRFVGGKPWVHLDVYAWTDKPDGALGEVGGNGQAIQCLASFFRNVKFS